LRGPALGGRMVSSITPDKVVLPLRHYLDE